MEPAETTNVEFSPSNKKNRLTEADVRFRSDDYLPTPEPVRAEVVGFMLGVLWLAAELKENKIDVSDFRERALEFAQKEWPTFEPDQEKPLEIVIGIPCQV